jgi:hypothetical protein
MEHSEWLDWGIFFGVSSLAISVGIVRGLTRRGINEKQIY